MTRLEHLIQRINALVQHTSVEAFGAGIGANQGLSWTSNAPTKPGWYWHLQRSDLLREPLLRVVEVHQWESGVWVSETGAEDPIRANELQGEWAGPLEPPPFEVRQS